MDSAGCPRRGRGIRVGRAVVLAVLLAGHSFSSPAQNTPQRTSSTDFKATIHWLFEQERWQEIVQNLTSQAISDPDLDYYYGSALAHLGRWHEAQASLLAGYHRAPQDKRFAVELAGIAFKQQHYPEAARWLRHGLRIDPADDYADNFLATVYFLQGNLEAALKYWNRIDKPQITTVRLEHPVQISPELLDRALTFAPAGSLQLSSYLTSKIRVEGLEVFPAARFHLDARDDGKFDVSLNLAERNGWGSNKWEALLSTFRGLPYETIYPEYFNIEHSAINVISLFRFDAQKRRLMANLTGPLRGNPKRRYHLGVDLRNENWAVRNSFTGVAPVLGSLNLRREAGSAEVASFESGRWDWSAAVELSHRDYRNVDLGTTLTPQLLLEGVQLKEVSQIRYELWRLPEHRLLITSGASAQLGRIWSQPAEFFAKVQGSCMMRWFPKPTGDDYETQVKIRSGGIMGSAPFDELYMLGLERDNDLWLRAHIGTRDGQKGSAPLGRQYFLTNSEVDKKLYDSGFLSLKLSPFVDSGKIADALDQPENRRWLWDTGLQAKLRVLGVGLNFTWGKDLLTGNNAFYFIAVR